MKGGAAAVAFLIFVVVIGSAVVYFYYFTQVGPAAITVPVQQQPAQQQSQQQLQKASFTVNVDTTNDVVYVDNYGTITGMIVYVDGQQVPAVVDLSQRTGVIALQEPLTAGEHTIMVQAGNQAVEKRVLVAEQWVADFTVAASW
jgi:hypothetical protein